MKIIRLILVLSMLLSIFSLCAGCTQTPTETGAMESVQDQLTEEELAILAQRRDTAEQYMREMVSVLWKADKNISYDLNYGNSGKFKIVADRIYRGLPYTYACGTKASFLEYASNEDERGVFAISDLYMQALNGSGPDARVGNDCSSAVTAAWSLISPTVTSTRSSMMFEDYGVIPVGDYIYEPTIDPETNLITDTFPVININGKMKMYEAYAQLQKADAVSYVGTSANHTRMVVDVNVVYTPSGDIDGVSSTVTVLEQTRNNFLKEKTEVDPRIGGPVYVIGGIDVKYTFGQLAAEGYVPVTVRELVEPTPEEQVEVSDSVTNPGKDTMLTGTIRSNMYIDCVTVTIQDEQGNTVQQATAFVTRNMDKTSEVSNKNFEMEKFTTDNPGAIRGELSLEKLKAGTYRCITVCRLNNTQEFTVRDFTFDV